VDTCWERVRIPGRRSSSSSGGATATATAAVEVPGAAF